MTPSALKTLHGLLFLLSLVFMQAAFAGNLSLSFIDLKHRQSQDILPLIEPFVAPEGSISGSGYQLIIRTTPANLATLKSIVQKFDTRVRQLRVSVTQDSRLVERERALQVNAQLSNRGGHIDIKVLNTQARSTDHSAQHIRVLEGHPAWIQVGEAIPVPTYYETYRGNVVNGVRYKPVLTGFYLKANTIGNEVIIDISPNKARVNRLGHRIQMQQAHTVVRTHLGVWVTLGGDLQEKRQHQRGIVSRRTAHREDTHDLYLKVDEIQ